MKRPGYLRWRFVARAADIPSLESSLKLFRLVNARRSVCVIAMIELGCGSPRTDHHLAHVAMHFACDTCRIQMNPRYTIGEDTDPVAIMPFSRPILLSEGRVLIAPVGNAGQLALFDTAGELSRVLGRAGDGPGEYRNIQDIASLPDKRIVVLDHRLTLLTPAFSTVASVAQPNGVRGVRLTTLGPQRMLLNSYGAAGTPFYIVEVDSTMHFAGGFGEHGDPGDPDALQYAISGDGSGGFWAARRVYRYDIEHYDSTGQLIDSIVPTSRWFYHWSLAEGAYRNPRADRPLPRVAALWLDGRRRLWVIGITADVNWHPTAKRLPPGRERGHYDLPSPNDQQQLYDTIIDVIDTQSRRVIASRRFDGVVAGMTQTGLAWMYVEEPSGSLQVQFIRLTLPEANVSNLTKSEDQ